MLFQLARGALRAAESATRGPDPGCKRRSAGALSRRRARGARRSHRRHPAPGEGITIYPIQSPELKAFDDQPERWLDVRWDIDEDNKERFPPRSRFRDQRAGTAGPDRADHRRLTTRISTTSR
jgi:hypothetical protein